MKEGMNGRGGGAYGLTEVSIISIIAEALHYFYLFAHLCQWYSKWNVICLRFDPTCESS